MPSIHQIIKVIFNIKSHGFVAFATLKLANVWHFSYNDLNNYWIIKTDFPSND